MELTSLEKCEARVHTGRVTKAFEGASAPTPGAVGDTLRGLGYIDDRVQGLRRSGEGVRFTLDLRLMDGQLCLDGEVTPTGTTVDPYGARGTDDVECADVRRDDRGR
ncbi:hypothetical protein F9278_12290 [Streptomyces phaeolivaceus]|uniref:Uncharacterized protein n=1 Tax=Streptomyces phaeolivaceus TaxID=2653200 RepID=A0A5P8K2K4_9ACTN|nr:hypothetical protein F9278_12290 [Streptomyces phaeolivaceus]